MPLFLVKHFVIPLNPNGPKCNTLKKLPNGFLLAILYGNPLAKKRLFPIEAIVMAGAHSIKLMHNESGPSPSFPSLDAIQKFMLNRSTFIRQAKDTLLGDGGRNNLCPLFINRYRFVPYRPNERGLFTGSKGVPNL